MLTSMMLLMLMPTRFQGATRRMSLLAFEQTCQSCCIRAHTRVHAATAGGIIRKENGNIVCCGASLLLVPPMY